MVDTSTSDTLSTSALAYLAGALLLVALGESAAIQFRSGSMGLAVVIGYGVLFCALAWYQLPLAVLALVVALPLITVEVGVGDVEKTLSADKAAVAAVTSVWFVRRSPLVWSRLIRAPAVKWWVFFLIVVLVSGLRNGVTVTQGWGILEQTAYAGVFLMALDVLQTRPVLLRRVLVAAGCTGCAVAFLALAEWASETYGHRLSLYFKHGTVSDPWVAGSTIAHRNFLGAYLLLVMPVFLAVSCVGTGRLRVFAILGTGLIGLTLIYTTSLGAYIALGATCLLTVGLMVKGLLPRGGRLAVVLMLTSAVIIGLGVVSKGVVPAARSAWGRVVTYRVGLAAIEERPFLGFGANGYPKQFLRLEQRVFGGALQDVNRADEPLSAHSSFVNVAVERGLFGLVAFAGLLVSLLNRGIKSYLCREESESRMLLLGLLAGLVAFVIQAFTENLFSYSKVAAIFWIMAAGLVYLAGSGMSPANTGGKGPSTGEG